MLKSIGRPKHLRGFTLLEILITILIVSFGLLGLAGLQAKIQVAEAESYQRAQAILLLSAMTERISANRAQAANYVSTTVYGTGDSQSATCSATPGSTADICEWSNALKGAAEVKSSTNVGAMIGARGCITQVQAQNSSAGVCTPGIYQVAIAWQGLSPTVAPAIACGKDLYGSSDSFRRLISSTITVPLTSCS